MKNQKKQDERKLLRDDELALLCLKLSMLTRAGISFDQSFAVLLDDAASPEEKAWLQPIQEKLEDGMQLSQALAEVQQFPPYLLAMLKIGEVSGKSEAVLAELAVYYRREAQLKASIADAVKYPAAMLAITSVILLVLVFQVLPVFNRMFDSLAASFSVVGKSFVQFGAVFKWGATIFAIVLLVALVVCFCVGRRQAGLDLLLKKADSLLFRGRVGIAIARSRFAASMSLMLASGMGLDETLAYAQALLANSTLAPKLKQCRELMAEGVPFAAATAQTQVFSSLQAGLLAAGFRAGFAQKAMEELAARCEEEADQAICRTLNYVQPILILFLAVLVGLLLLSVMLPLLGVMTAIG